MEYEEIPHNPSPEKLSLDEATSLEEKIIGLLGLVLYGEDYNLAIEKSLEFSNSPDNLIKGCAFICFGHLARLHGKLDLDRVIPVFKANQHTEDSVLKGKMEDAISDIVFFLKVKEGLFR
ncbi:hypothetical protein SAMN04487891_103260 [Flagellimonas taeanensis]|uniref:Uncharacterized protein n=1 Tax=Flagellimonas taeanensis TaxID=1005926 RepID=A0A1M6TL13_9FLAO|nr:hypothetical protein [Allomuricauda taeanensis]MEE1962245.1 hypothetical protein [Allomuricauda taeanensis]SFB89004.1 hypothetical protein SAMN04487891_103260 [Allomuricauda taeanensis]SHK57624.1 hypothetical protein SAMN05216293_1421 [Allomuricauda taeanensis]